MNKTVSMVYVALFSVVLAVCSWLTVYTAVPFTLQTFAVFLAVIVLGGKRGSLAVGLYLALGALGIPVFAGFVGGIGHLLGSTGGYLFGLLLCALVMWAIESVWGSRMGVLVAAMVCGLLVCYAFGTVWFVWVYARTTGPIGVGTALLWCVVPYILPDIAKMALAVWVGTRVQRVLSHKKRT